MKSPAFGADSNAFAKPEVQHFHRAVRPQLDVRGFQIAVDNSRSCAASSDSAICSAIGSTSSTGIGPCPRRPASRRGLDQFEPERLHAIRFFEAVDCGDVRMVERGQQLRLTLETGDAIRITCEGFRQDLQRDLAIQLNIARAIDLAHSARPKGGENLVRAEARPIGQGHESE